MGLTSKLGRGIAHPIMGGLPEQRELAKKWDWYNLRLGVATNSIIEGISSVLLAGLNPEIALVFIPLAFTDVCRVVRPGEVYIDSYNYYGSVLAEVPWKIGKSLYRAGKTGVESARRSGEDLSDYFWEHR